MNGASTPAGGVAPEPPPIAQVLRFLPDVLRMFAGVVRDPRVPTRAKAAATGLIALGLSPVDAVPVLGVMGLLASLSLATRTLFNHAGADVLREHWDGTDEGFAVVLALVGAGLGPTRVAWRLLRRAGR